MARIEFMVGVGGEYGGWWCRVSGGELLEKLGLCYLGAASLQKRYPRRGNKTTTTNPASHATGRRIAPFASVTHLLVYRELIAHTARNRCNTQTTVSSTSAMASARRTPNFPTRVPGSHDRPGTADADKEEIWKPMLDNISSGKRLPEKSLLVLGKTPRKAV
jgi:hypothetical protein